MLPFFEQAAGQADASQYDVEEQTVTAAPSLRHVGKVEVGGAEQRPAARLRSIASDKIERELRLSTDTWTASNFSFW